MIKNVEEGLERIERILLNFDGLEMKVEELKELGDLSFTLNPSIRRECLILHRVLMTCTRMMENEKAMVRIAAAKALMKIVKRRRIFVSVNHVPE